MKLQGVPLAVTALLAALAALSLWALSPPSVVPADAPRDRFSADRALGSVRQLARAPHPPGTTEHARVRDTVRDAFARLGLETSIQKTLAVRADRRLTVAVPVENVLARRPGSAPGAGPLILAAHYDSHPTGPGAGDDAAGVAALLETARALQGQPLRNDLLFLVTDAEEVGLVGAEGFVAQQGGERRGVVLNFEARGGGGPVFMFETGAGNAGLIDALAGAGARPVASSLMYALYKLLPNDTDLSVFKRVGYTGLNFAFVDRFQNYHGALDTPDGLDARSLQQHGDYALGLARVLGDGDLGALADPGQGEAVYFDLYARLLVRYPMVLAWPLTVLALGLYGLALYRSRREPEFGRTLARGAAILLETLVAAGALGYGLGLIAAPLRESAPNREPYGVRFGEAGLYLLALAAAAILWRQARGKATRPLALGALGVWALALVAVTAVLPGGAYLFLWPFVGAVAALLPERPGLWQALAGALIALALWPVILHGLFLLMGFGMAPIFAALAAFALAPLVPALAHARAWPSILCGLTGLLGLALFATPRAVSVEAPSVCTLLHFEDADTHEALWASADRAPGDWNRPFLGDHPAERPGTFFFPWIARRFLCAPAPPLKRSPVTVSRAGSSLRLVPAPGQRELVVWTDSPVRGARLEGRPIPLTDGHLRLRIVAPPVSGLSLTLDASAGTVVIVDGYTDGLPETVPARPAGWIPAPIAPQTDIQLVRHRVTL